MYDGSDDGPRPRRGPARPARATGRRSRLMLAAAALVAGSVSCTGTGGDGERPGDEAADGAVTGEVMARIRIGAPASGDTIDGPEVRVALEADGVDIVPAGIAQEGSGHHHLIVDAPLPSLSEPIPAEPGRYVHLGLGQTEFVLEGLDPGEHTVIALLGDHLHVPVSPPLADTVSFVVR